MNGTIGMCMQCWGEAVYLDGAFVCQNPLCGHIEPTVDQ